MQPCSNGDNFDARPIIFDLWFLLCAQVLSSDVHKTTSVTVPIFLCQPKRTVLIKEALKTLIIHLIIFFLQQTCYK